MKCQEKVKKQLPRCEHTATVPCWEKPIDVKCKEPCGGALTCCSKTCKSRCFDCQRLTKGSSLQGIEIKFARTSHVSHPCERSLYCQHPCGLDCSEDHHCNPRCKQACRQQCLHYTCRKPCSEPCAPCMEQCAWTCPHQTCPVACGSVCLSLCFANFS